MKTWSEVYGLNCEASNFNGSPVSPFSRANMIKLVRGLMAKNRIVFFNQDLKRQLLKYDPEKGIDDAKGDLADAFIHAAAHLIMNFVEGQNTKVVYS